MVRRILGARRSGRTGAVLALVALGLASPSLAMVPPLIALHVLLALHILIRKSSLQLQASQALVLSLWTVAPPLAALAPLRLIWSGSPWPAVSALLLGHWLVWRAVRQGLS